MVTRVPRLVIPGKIGPCPKPTQACVPASPTCPVSSGSVIVKQEPSEWGAGVLGGGASHATARAAVAMERANPPAELPQIKGSLELALLHCAVAGCHRPLKPLVFKLLPRWRRRRRGPLPRMRPRHHLRPCGPDLDAFVSGFRVPCPFEAYGCGSFVVYHDVAVHRDVHRDVCTYAPCPYALCPFTASPRMLGDHLAADHPWRVDALPSYGKSLQLRVSLFRDIYPPHRVLASDAHCLLVVEGDERRLFVLSVRALGGLVLGAYWAVSVACIRASAEAGPRHACLLWLQAPGMPAGKSRFLQMQTDVASRAVPGGE
ncbi:hypothetical protein BS78_09G195500 [Paspalum vaginatum]|nr:hypothetical protein BS78_09G195500 [Paspalum vaginatum]